MTFKPALSATQCAILKAYIQTGRIAHLYPRKKTISLNGFRALPIAQAIEKMKACLDSLKDSP